METVVANKCPTSKQASSIDLAILALIIHLPSRVGEYIFISAITLVEMRQLGRKS
jgi:hypothetical protein